MYIERAIRLPLALLIGFVEVIHSAFNYNSILFDIYWLWHSRHNGDVSSKIYNTIVLCLFLLSAIMWMLLLAKLSYEIYQEGSLWGGLFTSIPPSLLAGVLVNDVYRFTHKFMRRL